MDDTSHNQGNASGLGDSTYERKRSHSAQREATDRSSSRAVSRSREPSRHRDSVTPNRDLPGAGSAYLVALAVLLVVSIYLLKRSSVYCDTTVRGFQVSYGDETCEPCPQGWTCGKGALECPVGTYMENGACILGKSDRVYLLKLLEKSLVDELESAKGFSYCLRSSERAKMSDDELVDVMHLKLNIHQRYLRLIYFTTKEDLERKGTIRCQKGKCEYSKDLHQSICKKTGSIDLAVIISLLLNKAELMANSGAGICFIMLITIALVGYSASNQPDELSMIRRETRKIIRASGGGLTKTIVLEALATKYYITPQTWRTIIEEFNLNELDRHPGE